MRFFSRFTIFIFVAIGVNLAAFFIFRQLQPRNELRVYVFDVGQGDSILIETPSRRQILVDGGPSNRIVQKLGATLPFFDRTLDVVIATHPDRDHIFGLVEILRRYRVGMVFQTGITCVKAECKVFQELVEKQIMKGGQSIRAQIGQKIDLGDGATLVILHPFENLDGQTFSKPNESSIVVRIDYAGRSVLLTADIDDTVENKLMLAGIKLKADVLKVGHHGSKYSSTDEFLHAVAPKKAFISVGARNSYGHPTQEVLDRIANIGAALYRTDVDGDAVVHLRDDGTIITTRGL